MKITLRFLSISLLFAYSLSAHAKGNISSRVSNFRHPQIIVSLKTANGMGTCLILPNELAIQNSDGSLGKDNGLPLTLDEEKMARNVLQSASEVTYRVARRGEPKKIIAVYETTRVVLFDGDKGTFRAGPASSWLLDTAESLCASLK